MIRYLKAAFWARPRLAGLGAVPWNVVALCGASLLGFAEPSVWLAALGLETAYLYTFATNRRFQNWVDACDAQQGSVEAVAETQAREQLIRSLSRPAQERLVTLEQKIARVEHLYRETGAEDYVFDLNRQALQKLGWIYLKLLVAERNILQVGTSDGTEINGQIQRIRSELERHSGSASLRESKQATLALLEQRLQNLERRGETLAEIQSDFARIEAQIDLALEQASLEGRPATISANIDLVSHLLEDSFGEASTAVATLDETYRSQARTQMDS